MNRVDISLYETELEAGHLSQDFKYRSYDLATMPVPRVQKADGLERIPGLPGQLRRRPSHVQLEGAESRSAADLHINCKHSHTKCPVLTSALVGATIASDSELFAVRGRVIPW